MGAVAFEDMPSEYPQDRYAEPKVQGSEAFMVVCGSIHQAPALIRFFLICEMPR